MDIKGQVTFVGPIQTGRSERTGSDWKAQDIVVSYYENPTDRYADSVVVRIMNDKVDELALKLGDDVELGIGLSAREYDGRHYQEVRAFRINKVGAAAAPAPEQASTGHPAEEMPSRQPGAWNEPPF